MNKPAIKITSFCVLCKAEDHPHFVSVDGRVLTRVEWLGTDIKTGRPVLKIEMQAGAMPNQIEYPGFGFSANACWCPGCRVLYRIGPPHPNEPQVEAVPQIEVAH